MQESKLAVSQCCRGILPSPVVCCLRKKYSNSNIIMHETSQYHVQHLATFIMDKSESIVTVDDAIRKLLLLNSKEKIWTQEMLLQVNDKSIRLLDCESQEELEDFPLPTVQHCQTVLNQMRYSSILLLVCQDSEQHKPDIHFFNCDEVEAEMVHEDIESALADHKHGKKIRPQTLKANQEKIKQRQSILPPPQGPAPIPIQHDMRGQAMNRNRVAPPAQYEPGTGRAQSVCPEGGDWADNLPETAWGHFSPTVSLHCAVKLSLDPVENLVRIYLPNLSVLSLCNLEGTPFSFGAGRHRVQTLRVADFSVFGFCFFHGILNLSCKTSHTPLCLCVIQIVNSCGGPELARSVISPLLSKDATDFLRGHLTPKEISLWDSLGELDFTATSWPREANIPTYIPKFRNGWEPPIEIFRGAPWEIDIGHLQEEVSSVLPTIPPSLHPSSLFFRGICTACMCHFFLLSPTYIGQKWGGLTSSLFPSLCQVLEDNKQWWKLLNRSGQAGYVPYNILDVVKLEELEQVGYGPSSPTHKLPASYAGDKWGKLLHQMDEVNDELLKKITNSKIQPPQRNFRVEKPQEVFVPLTFESSAEEVKAWLEAKSFSKGTVEHLGILTGAQLFSLNREELKKVCGDEGNRVYSKITVEKNQLEVSSRLELQEIMKRRQERIDSAN
uniref:EPS8 like 2 n=1 Tax=Pavo cristatus TaxID=9049 RepID=A0A8C9ELA3_PAVCR